MDDQQVSSRLCIAAAALILIGTIVVGVGGGLVRWESYLTI